MEKIVRSASGAALQTSQFLRKPVEIRQYTTLNEKFNIHEDIAISTSDIPGVAYVGIGNGGHAMAIGADGVARVKVIQHEPEHAGLYNQLPFVLRLPNNDLSAAERVNYRLRGLVTVGGVTYVAYYLKVLDLSGTATKLELRTINNGVTTSSEYTPTLANLSPTPPPISTGEVLVASGDYLAATAKVPFTLSENDITEFINVCNIYYGDESYAMISEVALCSGIDRAVVGDFNGVSLGYTDAVAVQIVSFISTFYLAPVCRQGIPIVFDVGSLEPLLVLKSN